MRNRVISYFLIFSFGFLSLPSRAFADSGEGYQACGATLASSALLFVACGPTTGVRIAAGVVFLVGAGAFWMGCEMAKEEQLLRPKTPVDPDDAYGGEPPGPGSD